MVFGFRWSVLGIALLLFGSGSALGSVRPSPQQLTLQFFNGEPTARSSAITQYTSYCLTRGRQQYKFRRFSKLRDSYQELLQDPSPEVRLAAMSLGRCFHKKSILKTVAGMVKDSSPEVSLEAMTQLAHAEDRAGISALSRWLLRNDQLCLGARSAMTQRCIFAAYALWQCAQHDLVGDPMRIQAAKIVQMFLSAEVPKLREVAATSLFLVGTTNDKAPLKKLVDSERLGQFKYLNARETVQRIASKINRLPKP